MAVWGFLRRERYESEREREAGSCGGRKDVGGFQKTKLRRGKTSRACFSSFVWVRPIGFFFVLR